MTTLPNLPVWNYFTELSRIPRASHNEEGVRVWLKNIAENNNLEYEVDEVGNVIIRKDAQHTTSKNSVLLQAHLDMVTVKSEDSNHRFDTDPIELVVDGDWLKANNTTLGADNGIGLCEIVAILADKQITHPPLEALFTVNEETGMTGALGLKAGVLNSTIMLNFDWEETRTVAISSAGGRSLTVTCDIKKEPFDGDVFELTVGGLAGGHSGLEIGLPRINAIMAGAEIIRQCGNLYTFRLIEIQGGQAGNAIPSAAKIVLGIEKRASEKFEQTLDAAITKLSKQFAIIEKNITFQVQKIETKKDEIIEAYSEADTQKILGILGSLPQGVLSVSQQIPGLVETSNNLGIIKTDTSGVCFTFHTRSSVDIRTDLTVSRILSVFSLAFAVPLVHQFATENPFSIQSGCVTVKLAAHFSGWSESIHSNLLNTFQRVHTTIDGKPASVEAIHAGLECGVIKKKLPAGSEVISFGPTISQAHTPREQVSFSSVALFDSLVQALLAELAGGK